MIVKRTWTRTIIIIAVTSSIRGNMIDFDTTTESSADYLRKVMGELQDLNVPPSPTTNHLTASAYFDVDDKNFLAAKRYSDGKRILQRIAEQIENSGSQALLPQSNGKKLQPIALDQTFAESATHNQYYQVPAIAPAPQKVIPAETSGFTKAELAAAYNHALEQGSAVSLNALANVLRHKQMPNVAINPMEFPPPQPMYTYHYYPMKSFMNDMRHNVQSYVMPLVPNLRPEKTEMMQETQKEVANPLFMAITGFIGMAILFMIGVIMFPRFSEFNSRISEEDEYFYLTKTIDDAIDNRNCTDYPDIVEINKISSNRKPVKMARPSSVVLLTSDSIRQKDATKRRRKIHRNCKNGICKNRQRAAAT